MDLNSATVVASDWGPAEVPIAALAAVDAPADGSSDRMGSARPAISAVRTRRKFRAVVLVVSSHDPKEFRVLISRLVMSRTTISPLRVLRRSKTHHVILVMCKYTRDE